MHSWTMKNRFSHLRYSIIITIPKIDANGASANSLQELFAIAKLRIVTATIITYQTCLQLRNLCNKIVKKFQNMDGF